MRKKGTPVGLEAVLSNPKTRGTVMPVRSRTQEGVWIFVDESLAGLACAAIMQLHACHPALMTPESRSRTRPPRAECSSADDLRRHVSHLVHHML